jgi:hypothetical protein
MDDDKKIRVTFRLDEQTYQRLAIHATLEGQDQSRVAEMILSEWLTQFGEGREIFGPDCRPIDPPGPADEEGWQTEAA